VVNHLLLKCYLPVGRLQSKAAAVEVLPGAAAESEAPSVKVLPGAGEVPLGATVEVLPARGGSCRSERCRG
jgi:hypothetical protein